MKGKASDICTMCKHCEGSVDIVEKSYYICGVSHSDGGLYHLMPVEDELYCMSFEEVTMNKVEGKVSDWCPKCKNCKGGTKESNGVHVWLTEVECEDPYDGMVKTLAADSDICCSMFEVRKEKEPFNLNMPREAIKAIAKLNNIISELEKEKEALTHVLYPGEKVCKEYSEILEDIKELKKNSTYYDRYKTFTDKIQSLLFQDDHTYEFDEIIKEIKDLKVYSEENGRMYKEVQEWREKCIARGIDVDRLLSENKEKDKKISELEARVKYWGDIATGSAGQIINFKDEISKLNQTISDQEVTIKALLITIKEMCKEDETNE